jgi:hypothetical protein
MAAQERAKHAGHKPTSSNDGLPIMSMSEPGMKDPPPPAFDMSFLPPQVQVSPEMAAPPSFDVFSMQHVEMKPAPVAVPSAPTFDLLDLQPAGSAPQMQTQMQMQSSPLDGFEQLLSAPVPPALSPEEEIIMGMEGLTAEERRALIDEQRTIMDQIEKEKAANEAAIAAAAADDFDQRSAPAVANIAGGGAATVRMPTTSGDKVKAGRFVDLGGGKEVALHGPEKTRAAIKDGTAILVQCVNCENWMQVTGNATMMYCPVCAVVSPVEVQSAVSTREEALQMTMDRRMAEQMQKEEYEAANQEGTNASNTKVEEEEASWWDTVSSMFSVKMANETVKPQSHKPLQRGEVGVSLPPGASKSGGALRTARGDLQFIDFTSSGGDERDGLLGNEGGSRARVAERKPMFSCMVDSVANAGTYLGSALTAQTLSEDAEGNVHGVDASSLLSMSTVSRDTDYKPL